MTSSSITQPQAKTTPVKTTPEKTTPARSKPTAAIVVFGLDQANKPRAASFPADQVEAAKKAAELMKLAVLKVEGPDLTPLAARLEVGRIYASGQGFVPPIQPHIYERLVELADPKSKAAPGLPPSWDDIKVGHLVLGQEVPGEGWWESIVVAKNNDMLTLKLCGYPGYPQVVCHRTAVGLLKPTPPEA